MGVASFASALLLATVATSPALGADDTRRSKRIRISSPYFDARIYAVELAYADGEQVDIRDEVCARLSDDAEGLSSDWRAHRIRFGPAIVAVVEALDHDEVPTSLRASFSINESGAPKKQYKKSVTRTGWDEIRDWVVEIAPEIRLRFLDLHVGRLTSDGCVALIRRPDPHPVESMNGRTNMMFVMQSHWRGGDNNAMLCVRVLYEDVFAPVAVRTLCAPTREEYVRIPEWGSDEIDQLSRFSLSPDEHSVRTRLPRELGR